MTHTRGHHAGKTLTMDGMGEFVRSIGGERKAGLYDLLFARMRTCIASTISSCVLTWGSQTGQGQIVSWESDMGIRDIQDAIGRDGMVDRWDLSVAYIGVCLFDQFQFISFRTNSFSPV
jgi:hypothetical protein